MEGNVLVNKWVVHWIQPEKWHKPKNVKRKDAKLSFLRDVATCYFKVCFEQSHVSLTGK